MTSLPTGGGGALREMHHLFAEGTATALPDGQLLERFLTRGDDAAFRALVRRHGRMVLGVCRSVLRNPADAEDAFQATFLVLVSKGRSIRGHEALGGWLRQVAHRVAVQAGADAVRRRARERRAADASRLAETTHGAGLDDWREILHEELAGLSEKHRLPLLLCDLEGKTHAQAAEELGCGPATVQRRLNAVRARLRSRLIRRGVAPTAGMLALGRDELAAAQVPASWVEATVRAAGSWGSRAGRLAFGHVAATSAAALASKSVRAMMLSQLRAGAAAAVFLAAVAGVVWKAGLAAQDGAGRGAMPGMKKAQAARASSVPPVEPGETKEAVVYQGRVLDPDGKPLAKAAVSFLSYRLRNPDDNPIRAATGADGRFRFAIAGSEFDRSSADEPGLQGTVLAAAPGLGFGMVDVGKNPGELMIRLVRDDVPISGRVIDLQGRPVAGATVSVFAVGATADGRLDRFLNALQERNEVQRVLQEFVTQRLEDQPDPPLVPAVVTGADGRFRIKGVGRERIAGLQIEGPTIETRLVMALTRPGPTMRVPLYKLDGGMPADQVERMTFYGASFDHVAGPTRPVEGVVSDMDTGRPLAGIMVHAEADPEAGPGEHIRAFTDAQGRYRLVGLPQGKEGHILAVPPCDFPRNGLHRANRKVPPDEALPYLRARLEIGKVDGPGPAHLDIELKRGVWLTGRVLDRQTRQPVGGQVEYFVYTDNPHMAAYPVFGWTMIGPHLARADGVFHFVVFPGPGVLAARAGGSQYIRAAGLEKLGNKVENGLLMTHPYNAAPTNFNVVDPIDPAPKTGSMTHDLLLESGRTLPVKVLDPDGQPVNPAELMTVGLRDMSGWEKVPAGRSELKIVGLGPGRGRTIEVRHEARRLVGELSLRGDETGPQTIRLQRWGVLTGRIVDADGEPVGSGNIYPIARPAGYPEIGKDGRFRVDGIIPDKPYDLQLLKDASLLSGYIAHGVKVGPGETGDLGDVRPGK